MNTTFNLKRFFLLEKYKKQETGKHLLWSAGVVLGICLLCMMYDINKGASFYTEQTQAASLSRYTLWFLCIAPCLLEASISKHNFTLYLLLPASALEKVHAFMAEIYTHTSTILCPDNCGSQRSIHIVRHRLSTTLRESYRTLRSQ